MNLTNTENVTDGFQRFALEERLRRLRDGETVSPLFALHFLQEFAETPVAYMLDSLRYYDDRAEFVRMLRSRKGDGTPDRATFGSLAQMILSDYRKWQVGKLYRNHERETLCFIKCYLVCIEALDSIRKDLGASFQRERLGDLHQRLYDFCMLSLRDYGGYVDTLPKRYSAYYCDYTELNGCSPTMSVLQLFSELKTSALERKGLDPMGKSWISPSFESISDAAPFLETFIGPLAFLQPQPGKIAEAERSKSVPAAPAAQAAKSGDGSVAGAPRRSDKSAENNE